MNIIIISLISISISISIVCIVSSISIISIMMTVMITIIITIVIIIIIINSSSSSSSSSSSRGNYMIIIGSSCLPRVPEDAGKEAKEERNSLGDSSYRGCAFGAEPRRWPAIDTASCEETWSHLSGRSDTCYYHQITWLLI